MKNYNYLKSKKILIVEDEQDLLSLYEELLAAQGCDITSTTNGEEALKLIKQGGFDLVLLDIMLPGMDGFEILEKIEQEQANNRKQPANTIVVLTNLSQEQTIARATEHQVRGYMVKSNYTPEEFVQQINEFFKEVEQEQNN